MSHRTKITLLVISGLVLSPLMLVPLAVVGLILMLRLGLGEDGKDIVIPDITPNHQQIAAHFTRHTFPQSTKFHFYQFQGFQDLFLELKIELPVVDIPTLLASGPFKDAPLDCVKNGLCGYIHARPNFDPRVVTKFRYAECEPAAARSLRILIDESRSDVATVYFVYMEC